VLLNREAGRYVFRAPTRFYKTGIVFLAYLNGLQDHFLMIGEQQSVAVELTLRSAEELCGKLGVAPGGRARPDESGSGRSTRAASVCARPERGVRRRRDGVEDRRGRRWQQGAALVADRAHE
jgi:hypothetical protein